MGATGFLRLFSLLLLLYSQVVKAQWVPTSGPCQNPITCLVVATNGSAGASLLAGTSAGTIFRSTNAGSEWSEADSGLAGTYVSTIIVDGSHLFAATDSGAYVSTNGGVRWSGINDGLAKASVHALASHSPNLFAGTDNGVYVSSNLGATWAEMDSGLTTRRVLSVAISGTNIIAGTSGGGIFLSSDEGARWRSISSVEYALYVSVTKLFTRDANVYAAVSWMPQAVAFYSGIFVSSDHGASWSSGYVTGSIEGGGMDVFDVASIGNSLFEAASFESFLNPSRDGVFMSTDTGRSWFPSNTGLTDSSVFSLAVDGHSIFAGTSKSGVWKRPISELVTSVQPGPVDQPRVYYLSQNFPNPFNPTTNIKFQIPNSNFVMLTVYDVLGREVATLVSERLSTGTYTRQLNAAGLSSGVYFYRLQAGSYTETKRLLLLR